MVNPKKKYKFWKQGANYLKRVKERWRKPRGRDTKLRKKQKGKGKVPSIGYGAPAEMRHKHPSGLYELLVSNVDDLSKIDPENQAARISGSVGKKKKLEIVKKAKELKIKVLNP